jgi:hypothetical protein
MVSLLFTFQKKLKLSGFKSGKCSQGFSAIFYCLIFLQKKNFNGSIYNIKNIIDSMNKAHPSVCRLVYLCVYLFICPCQPSLSICLSHYLFICPSIHLSVYLFVSVRACLSVWPSVVYLPICLPFCLSACQSVLLSFCPISACLSVCHSAYLPLCLSVCPSLVCPSALLPFCPSVLLPFCPSALLPFCPSALLPIWPSGLLPFCPSAVPIYAVSYTGILYRNVCLIRHLIQTSLKYLSYTYIACGYLIQVLYIGIPNKYHIQVS